MSVQWNPISKPLQYSSKSKNWHLQYFGKNMDQMPAVCHHHSKDVVVHLLHNFHVFWLWCFFLFSRSKSMLQRQNISLTITGIEVILMIFFHLCLDSKRLISKTIALQQDSFFLSVAHIHATEIGLYLTSFISFFKSKSALELSNLSWWPRLALPCCIWPPPFFALFPNEFGQGAFFPSLTALFTFGLFDRLVRLHTKGEDHKLKIPFFQPVQPSSWFHDSLGDIETMKSQ